MRQLKTSDVFTLIKIFGKMGLKKDLNEFAQKITAMNTNQRKLNTMKKTDKGYTELEIETEEYMTELGLMIPTIFLENFEKAEKEIKKLFASLKELTEEEYINLSAEDTLDLIIELKESEEFKSFFTKALKLFNK